MTSREATEAAAQRAAQVPAGENAGRPAAAGAPRAARRSERPRLRLAMLAVGLLATLAAALGVGVRSTHGGHASVDEPQYLLTALSLGTQGSLDISDVLRTERWRQFHQAQLPVQTAVLPGGRQLSPHDPLLPVLLAVPMALGGWVAAKLTLAVLAGLLAALTLWLAVRRFAVPLRIALPGVALAACSAPLAIYGQQVYPELPAALVTTAGVALLTGPSRRPGGGPSAETGSGPSAEADNGPCAGPAGGRRGRRPSPVGGIVGFAGSVVALPWLSVKYIPVAAALAAVGLARLWRQGEHRAAGVLAGALGVAAAGYLVVHRLVWGGWTVYASGDHFQASGELGVVGFHPNYPGRSIRLLGLLIDRDFGIAGWQPAWLLAVPALAVLLRCRPPGWLALAAPLAAGWLSATYLALTMQGFWSPGRQLVVVLPLALVGTLWWLARLRARWVRLGAAALALLGVGYYVVLLAHGYAGDTTWVAAPDRTDLHQPMAWLLPDDRDLITADYVRLVVWTVAALLVAVLSARQAPAPRRRGRSTGRHAARAAVAARTSR